MRWSSACRRRRCGQVACRSAPYRSPAARSRPPPTRTAPSRQRACSARWTTRPAWCACASGASCPQPAGKARSGTAPMPCATARSSSHCRCWPTRCALTRWPSRTCRCRLTCSGSIRCGCRSMARCRSSGRGTWPWCTTPRPRRFRPMRALATHWTSAACVCPPYGCWMPMASRSRRTSTPATSTQARWCCGRRPPAWRSRWWPSTASKTWAWSRTRRSTAC